MEPMKELEDELQRAQKRARLAEEKQADLQKALQKAEEKQADLQNALEKAEEKQSDLQKALQNAEEEKQAEVQNALQNAEKEKQAEEEKHKALEIARKAQADAMQLQLQNAIMKKQLRESVAHLVANSKKTSDFRKAQSENYIIRVQNPHGHSVADDLVKQIWDSVRSAKNVDGKTFRFPNEPIASKGGKLRENEDVHPLIMDLSKFIQLNLGMIENAFFNGPGLWFQEQIVYPDIVIAASGLTKPTFVDAKTLFELKLPKKYEDTDVSTAGTQQAFGYLFFAVQSLPPSSAERTQRVAMYCNYDEISSLKLQAPDDFIFELFGPCELFPEGWRVREEPTVGFKLLCSVLSIPIAPIIFTINGRPMKVVSKLVEEPDFSIYRIEINGQEYAAKKGSTLLDGRPAWKHASDTIHSEIRKLSILKDIVDLQPFILTPLWEYTSISESVLVMPFGEDLHMWWGVNMSFSADIVIPNDLLVLRLKKFYRFISNIFSGLVVLHKNDWVHADIRPKNILIVDNNSARLIDWATAHHKIAGLSMHFLHQGAVDPFMPDELYQEFHHQPPCTLFPAKWDFISLAYCIFGLTGLFDGLPSTDQKEFLQVRGLRIENVREPLEGEIPFRTELNLWAKQFWAVANSVDNYPNEEQVARMRAVIEAKVI